MNKQMTAFFAVTVVLAASSNAFASRARELVMGTADPFGVLSTSGTHGSFYYDDNYNIFYNPSYVNDFKNWATIERTNGTTPSVGANSGAEGGTVAGFMNFNVGVFFNRGDAISTGLLGGNAQTGAAGTGLLGAGAGNVANYSNTNTRPIDILVGGDLGMAKVGVALTTGSFKNANTSNSHETSIRVGAQIMDIEPFVGIKINGDDVSAPVAGVSTETKYKGITAGVKYHWGEWTPFAGVRTDKQQDVNGNELARASAWGLGVGRNAKLGEGSRLNYAVSYWKGTVAGGLVADRKVLPIDMSFESDFASWITGRAGLSYRLLDRTGDNSVGSSPTGRMGLTIHASKVDFDWAIGGSSGIAGGSAVYGNPDAATFDIGSGFFTAASATYHW